MLTLSKITWVVKIARMQKKVMSMTKGLSLAGRHKFNLVTKGIGAEIFYIQNISKSLAALSETMV